MGPSWCGTGRTSWRSGRRRGAARSGPHPSRPPTAGRPGGATPPPSAPWPASTPAPVPSSKLGVDVKKNFAPQYVPVRSKAKTLEELKKAAKKATELFVATDPDREGEAIGWHVAQELRIPKQQVYRVLFNEITERAVKAAFREPGRIDQKKVDAQQARRVLDRLVGYKISPLLWERVQRGLSAGRVQSGAGRLRCGGGGGDRALLPHGDLSPAP